MKGFVYFFKHNNVDAVKIGFTTRNDLSGRFSAFCTSSPYGAKILGFISSDNPRKLEHTIHAELEAHRVNGEFFEITEEKVNHLISKYSKSNGLSLEALIKIERYVNGVDTSERNMILGKISRYFDSIINSYSKNVVLTNEESAFLKKYSSENGNIIKKTCSEIQSEYFPNESLRKVGLFLKSNGYIQRISNVKINGKHAKVRLYHLYF